MPTILYLQHKFQNWSRNSQKSYIKIFALNRRQIEKVTALTQTHYSQVNSIKCVFERDWKRKSEQEREKENKIMAKVFQCGWMNHDGNIGALEVFTRFFRVGWPKLFINIPYERRILGWIYLFFTHEHKKKYPSHNFFLFRISGALPHNSVRGKIDFK